MHAHRTSTDGEFQLIKETARALTSTSETSSTCLRSALTNDGWEGARQRAFGCVNKGTCVDVRPTTSTSERLVNVPPTHVDEQALVDVRLANVPNLVDVPATRVNEPTHVNVPRSRQRATPR